MEQDTEDRLDRGKFIEELGQLVRASETTPLPEAHGTILLDGKYGTGKTFAMRLLEAELSATNTRVVYFDAWEHEDVSDPIVTISSLISGGPYTGQKLLEAAINLAVNLTDRYLPGTGEVAHEVRNLLASREKSITDFRDELGKLVGSDENPSALLDGDTKTKLAILVDELDRCRPDFALKVLERIKHFFPVKGVTFVVCMDMGSMCDMITHAYGIRDAEGYLQKFYDHKVPLPEFDREAFASYLYQKKHAQDAPGMLESAEQTFIRAFAFIAHVYDISLRQMIRGVRGALDPRPLVVRQGLYTTSHAQVLASGLIEGLLMHSAGYTDEVCGNQGPEFRGLMKLLEDICSRIEPMDAKQKYAMARTLRLRMDPESDPDKMTKEILVYLLEDVSSCFGCKDARSCIAGEGAMSRLVDRHITAEDARHISESIKIKTYQAELAFSSSPVCYIYSRVRRRLPKPGND